MDLGYLFVNCLLKNKILSKLFKDIFNNFEQLTFSIDTVSNK